MRIQERPATGAGTGHLDLSERSAGVR